MRLKKIQKDIYFDDINFVLIIPKQIKKYRKVTLRNQEIDDTQIKKMAHKNNKSFMIGDKC